jgi:hypothetical protein
MSGFKGKKGGRNMKAELFELAFQASQGKANRLRKTAVQRAADVMVEMYLHPERFCEVCQKRKGICEHTKR